jgi:twinkle protein
MLKTGEYNSLRKRRISQETCEKFRYQVGTYEGEGVPSKEKFDGRPVHIANYCDETGRPVAQKIRTADKDFTFIGSPSEAGLFGQQLWREGGKRIVITEGEIDCMTVSQLQGNKWPVVSLRNGASGADKDITNALKWLLTFEEVVLMFDEDEAGREAIDIAVKKFPVGRVKIATLPLKDANAMLCEGRGDEVRNSIWEAKVWRPAGIVTFADLREGILRVPEMGLPWWLEPLTAVTYGRRFGEAYGFGAGTGIGKTDFFTQQMEYDIQTLGHKIGIFSLEQQPSETGKRLCNKFAGRTFHIPDSGWTQEELIETYDRVNDLGKLFLYDHFGCQDWDAIKNTIRYLCHHEGVRIFYLDHLTALATGGEEKENKVLERIMADIGGLVKELDIVFHYISHLTTPDGTPHEEGGRVTIRQFKGSRAIGYWSHFMFGMERNQQAEDPAERSITTLRCLKDRYTGRATGEMFLLDYDHERGRLIPAEEQAPSSFSVEKDPTQPKEDY